MEELSTIELFNNNNRFLLNRIMNGKYPIIVEISKDAKPFKIDESWNFDVSIDELNITY